MFDLVAVLGAGVLGYGLKYFGFPALPLVLGVVLGRIIENNFRRSIDLGYGDPLVFFKDPIAGVLLSLIILVIVSKVVLTGVRYFRTRRASTQAA
jgi:putative tricarboxylic transport membrane protein